MILPLLDVDNLQVHFARGGGLLKSQTNVVKAVDGVSFTLSPGQNLGLLGASGCGKSTIAQALVGLVPITSGSVRFNGQVVDMTRDHGAIQIVFQDPQTSFNPRRKVWQLITEPLTIAGERNRDKLMAKAQDLMAKVGLGRHQLDRYPHEFSGGQRQRLAIARALAIDPKLLILDEPTSALDISVQAQILNLLMQLQRDLNVAYLFISHDVSVVRHICDSVAVLQAGRIVETGSAADILAAPQHPYTRSLLNAVPSLDAPTFRAQRTSSL